MLSKILPIGENPTSNTGVSAPLESSLSCCVDWFQGTFPSKYLKLVEKLLIKYLGYGELVERPSGIKYFNKAFRHPSGAVIACGRKLPGGNLDPNLAYLELSGSVIRLSTQRKLRKFFRILKKRVEFKPTRLDLAVDDHEKKLLIKSVKKAADNHHYTGFKSAVQYHENGRKGSGGATVSFGHRGSRGSGKFLNFYDKEKESKGRIKAIRIELSLYKEHAKQVFEHLINAPLALWGQIFGGWISGAIDFRKRINEEDNHPGRRPRLRWWSRIVDEFEKITPVLTYKINTFDSLKDWIESQVAPTLATIMHGITGDDYWVWFWETIFSGEERMNDKHRYILQAL